MGHGRRGEHELPRRRWPGRRSATSRPRRSRSSRPFSAASSASTTPPQTRKTTARRRASASPLAAPAIAQASRRRRRSRRLGRRRRRRGADRCQAREALNAARAASPSTLRRSASSRRRAYSRGAPPAARSDGRLSLLAGYTALLLSGVLVLRLRVFVDALVRGPRGARGVALTFDDGPHPRWTPRVLDILARRGVRATFFVVGRKVGRRTRRCVRAIVDAGHAVGLHSYAHDRLFSLRGERRVREDLERGMAVLERVTGPPPRALSPADRPHEPDDRARGRRAGSRRRRLDARRAATAWPRARPEDVATRVRRDLRDGVDRAAARRARARRSRARRRPRSPGHPRRRWRPSGLEVVPVSTGRWVEAERGCRRSSSRLAAQRQART